MGNGLKIENIFYQITIIKKMGEAEANKRIAQWKQGTILNLSNLGLTSLQNFTLPSTLRELHCYNNQLTSLPTLPSTLRTLYCYINQLTSLPTLPSTLTHLDCSSNQLTSLPTLPSTLTKLYCYNNRLTSLSTLTSTLTYLDCYNNLLTSLPTLPTTLIELHCDNNQLTSLPTLPTTLIELHCNNNPFSFETPRSDNETPHEYWNRLEVVQSRKRTIKRNRDIKEELMMVCWHPSKVQKMLDLYGIDYEDYV